MRKCAQLRYFVQIVSLLCIVFSCYGLGSAQDTTKTAIKDTLQAKPVKPAQQVGVQEVELMEIKIEAVVEKPRVSILPKRIEPEFGEIEYIDRSFEHELKECSKELIIFDERLETAKKIEKLKKVLAKKPK